MSGTENVVADGACQAPCHLYTRRPRWLCSVSWGRWALLWVGHSPGSSARLLAPLQIRPTYSGIRLPASPPPLAVAGQPSVLPGPPYPLLPPSLTAQGPAPQTLPGGSSQETSARVPQRPSSRPRPRARPRGQAWRLIATSVPAHSVTR